MMHHTSVLIDFGQHYVKPSVSSKAGNILTNQATASFSKGSCIMGFINVSFSYCHVLLKRDGVLIGSWIYWTLTGQTAVN
jgi:hypothetical protein